MACCALPSRPVVVSGFIGFYRALSGFIRFYPVLSGFIRFYPALVGFTALWWAFVGFRGFGWDLAPRSSLMWALSIEAREAENQRESRSRGAGGADIGGATSRHNEKPHGSLVVVLQLRM